jgi:hypothetical protein
MKDPNWSLAVRFARQPPKQSLVPPSLVGHPALDTACTRYPSVLNRYLSRGSESADPLDCHTKEFP